MEENSQESSSNNERVKEGSVSDAINSRGARTRDPISLTPEILAMLNRHEPDKSKKAKLLTEDLLGQRVLPTTEEDLHQHLERKAKREAYRMLAATRAEHYKHEQARQAAAAHQEKNAAVV